MMRRENSGRLAGTQAVEHASEIRAWPWILLFMLIYATPYPFGTIILDTARDLFYAAGIAEGRFYPLSGPIIYEILHLSPLWFYLLAPIYALGHSQTLVAVFVGLLASTKFPLAYYLGKEVGGKTAGLILASCVALPGWTIMELLVWSHTNLVEAATFATLICVWKIYAGAGNKWYLLFGAAFGLALNMHPTAFLLLLLFFPAWLSRCTHGQPAWPYVGLASLCTAAFFIPPLVEEAQTGWPMLQRLSDYVQHRSGSFVWTRFFNVMLSAMTDGIKLLCEFWAGPKAKAPLYALFAFAWTVGIGGLLVGARRADKSISRAVLALLAAFFLIPLFLVLSRPRVPCYMLFVWQPVAATLLALGWHGWTRAFRPERVRAIALVIGLAFLSACSGTLIARFFEGQLQLPLGKAGNIELQATTANVALLPTYFADSINRHLCTAAKRQIFHADLAMLMDMTLLRSARSMCGEPNARILGGQDAVGAEHWLGLSPRSLKDIGIANPTKIAGWPAAKPAKIIYPETSEQIPDGPAYPPRAIFHSTRPLTSATIAFTTSRAARILFSNPLYLYTGNRLASAKIDGIDASTQTLTTISTLLTCDRCTKHPSVRWEIAITGHRPEFSEILIVDGDSLQDNDIHVSVHNAP